MNAHTQEEKKEMTIEEYAAKIKPLSAKKRKLLADPITKENVISLVYLLAEYIASGSHHNADDLHRRIGERRAILSVYRLPTEKLAQVAKKQIPAGQLL